MNRIFEIEWPDHMGATPPTMIESELPSPPDAEWHALVALYDMCKASIPGERIEVEYGPGSPFGTDARKGLMHYRKIKEVPPEVDQKNVRVLYEMVPLKRAANGL